MLTTLQVRAIIHKHSTSTYGIYTNKTKGHTGNDRRVKCYFNGNTALFTALRKLAGKENVTLTTGARGMAYGYGGSRGITVKCILE